jgi:hypothetical protein
MRKGALLIFLMGAMCALASCAVQVKNKWVRVDGQSIEKNPALVKQYEVDKTICEGEMQKADLSGSSFCYGLGNCLATGISRGNAMAGVGKGCMAQRGYLLTADPNPSADAQDLTVQNR